MKHVTFARFPDRDRAAGALKVLRGGEPVEGVELVVHSGARNAADFELQIQGSGDLAETDLRHALVLGAVLGLLCGTAFGLFLAAIGLFPGDLLGGALFGAVMGLLVGLLMMLMIGVGLTDRRLVRLTRDLREGEVVVTVECPDAVVARRVIGILRDHGAEVAEKSAV